MEQIIEIFPNVDDSRKATTFSSQHFFLNKHFSFFASLPFFLDSVCAVSISIRRLYLLIEG